MSSTATHSQMAQSTSWAAVLHPVRIGTHLWGLRELIGQLTRRELETLYRGSVLGVLWALIQPLALLGVYAIFFLYLLDRQPDAPVSGDARLVLGMFCALLFFNLFIEAISRAPQLVMGNPSYVKRIVFPLEVLPLSVLGALLVNFAVGAGVLLIGRWILLGSVPWTACLLPLVLLPFLLLTCGLSWVLASLGVFLRDVAQLIRAITVPLMFLTPIFWSLDMAPASMKGWLLLNPLTPGIESARAVAVAGELPNWGMLGVFTGVAALIAGGGYAWFMRTKSGFADVI